jgi:uncharacterized membrane protein
MLEVVFGRVAQLPLFVLCFLLLLHSERYGFLSLMIFKIGSFHTFLRVCFDD